jgi:diguanylate cyclase (GGDEF)-like protein
MEKQLLEMSTQDELTDLHNQRGFSMLAEQQMKMCKRMKKNMGIIFVEMDNLQEINTQYSQKEGDHALKMVANLLRETLRESDIMGRTGGDEYVIFVTDTNKELLQTVVKRIEKTFSLFNSWKKIPYLLSINMGTVYSPSDLDLSLEEIIAQADRVMHKHKQQKTQERD